MSNVIEIENKSKKTKAAKKVKTKEEKINENLDILRTLAVTAIIIILVYTFVARTATVNGESMTNTLQNGDNMVLWSLFYTPKQGDIVAANCEKLDEVLIKRVIAVGGQEVNIDFNTGAVYVDGELLDEPYIRNATINDEGAFNYPIVVDDGCYFCMGDNRQGSMDSRDPRVGLIHREDILGKAFLRFTPFNNIKIFR